MGERRSRSDTEELKRQAPELPESGGESARQLEDELRITPGMLSQSRRRYQGLTTERKEHLDLVELEAVQREIRCLEPGLREATEERDALKKSAEHLLPKRHMKYAFVMANEGEFPVMYMCRALGVGRSGNYAWRNRGPRA